MTKIFIVIFREEKTWQKPPCASLALKPGSSGVRIHRGSSRSHSAGVTCGTALAVLARACSQPAEVHLPTLQLLQPGSQQHSYSFSMDKHPGAEEMKLEVLKFHARECTSFGRVPGLCCVIPRSGLCRACTGMSCTLQLLRALLCASTSACLCFF